MTCFPYLAGNCTRWSFVHYLLIFLVVIPFIRHTEIGWSQENSKSQDHVFHFLPWPETGSILKPADKAADESPVLINAWNDNHLLSYTGQTLVLLPAKSDALDQYLRLVLYSQPECIEGDINFIEEEINSQKSLYVPILQEIETGSENAGSLKGEIVFLDQNDLWRGKLGVVHPRYSVGGKYQIDYWIEQSGNNPDVVTLNSPQETLRHLFVGSIQAAAVPEGAVEVFLKSHNRGDLSDRLIRIHIPQTAPLPVVFLRKDLFEAPLMRTLIGETWLRNSVEKQMMPLPVTVPRSQSG